MESPKADLFSASKMKLKRARQFIAELESYTASFIASNPVSLSYDPIDHSLMIEIRGTGLEPGAIVGDAIHNLRSALDLMASELARLKGRSDKNVYFPFADSADALDERIANRHFDKAGPDAVDLLKKFSPYRGGNKALRAIHDLDIQDKHSALVVVGAVTSFSGGGTFDTVNIENNKTTFAVADSFVFNFPEGNPFAGKPVIETLENLVELVDGILEAFAGLVAARV